MTSVEIHILGEWHIFYSWIIYLQGPLLSLFVVNKMLTKCGNAKHFFHKLKKNLVWIHFFCKKNLNGWNEIRFPCYLLQTDQNSFMNISYKRKGIHILLQKLFYPIFTCIKCQKMTTWEPRVTSCLSGYRTGEHILNMGGD